MVKSQITSYDSGTIAHFKRVLLAQRVNVMAKIQRNGNPIFVEEELNGTEKRNKREIIERHNAEVIGCQSQLRDIESALQKIKDRTYGFCTDCGVQILLARLEAMPTASRCVPCQTKHKKAI